VSNVRTSDERYELRATSRELECGERSSAPKSGRATNVSGLITSSEFVPYRDLADGETFYLLSRDNYPNALVPAMNADKCDVQMILVI